MVARLQVTLVVDIPVHRYEEWGAKTLEEAVQSAQNQFAVCVGTGPVRLRLDAGSVSSICVEGIETPPLD